MGISILVCVQGLGRLDGGLCRYRIGRRTGIAIPKSGRRAHRGNSGPLLLFRWIHQLCVMFGRSDLRVGIVTRSFGDMPAAFIYRDGFRAVSNRAFRQSGW